MCSLCVTGRLPAVRGRQQRFEEAAEDGEGGGDHLGHARPQGLRHAGKQGGRQDRSSSWLQFETCRICSQGSRVLNDCDTLIIETIYFFIAPLSPMNSRCCAVLIGPEKKMTIVMRFKILTSALTTLTVQ